MEKLKLKYDYHKTLFILYFSGVITVSLAVIGFLISNNEGFAVLFAVVDIIVFIGMIYFFFEFKNYYKRLITYYGGKK